MDHLLAAFFSLVFAHAATPQRLPQPVAMPSFAVQYETDIPAPIHRDPLPTVNRHSAGYQPASYAVSGGPRSHS